MVPLCTAVTLEAEDADAAHARPRTFAVSRLHRADERAGRIGEPFPTEQKDAPRTGGGWRKLSCQAHGVAGISDHARRWPEAPGAFGPVGAGEGLHLGQGY